MDSESESTLLSDVADAVIGVPDAIKKPLMDALSELLGGIVAIPAAKLNQIAQSIKDTTAARTLTSETMAKLAADKIAKDPAMATIAAEIYMPTTLRKAKNRLSVAKTTTMHFSAAIKGAKQHNISAPNDDWMNFFSRYAEDASSERLQDLFGRILAGQITRPGAFSLSTLRVLSELDQDIAEDFSYAWSKSVGDAVDYSQEWKLGSTYSLWKRLVEAGLMASSVSEQYAPPFIKELKTLAQWVPVNKDGVGLMVHFNKNLSNGWEHISFTRVGKEIGSIIDKPNYESNLKQMGAKLRHHGIRQVDYFHDGGGNEPLWKA